MSNEMVDIKKQVVATSSKKSYRHFKRNPYTDSKPPNAITSVESEEEEEEIITEEHIDEEEVVELQGMWDIILPDEEDQGASSVSTRSRNQLDPPQPTPKPKSTSSMTKDKVAAKKTTPKATQTSPIQTDSSTPSKTLIIPDEMEYNIIEDMKRTRAKITFYELSKLKHQQKILMKELHAIPVASLPAAIISQASHDMGRPPTNVMNKVDPNDIALIGGRSRSHTPPFLLTYEIFNKNVHNCLVDSGASSNILPKSICTKLNVQLQKFAMCIAQLDRSQVKVIVELNQVTIRLSSNPKVCQVIAILISDIPEFYGLILSRDWSKKFHGYFATDWSHMWLPYNGSYTNQIIDKDQHDQQLQQDGTNSAIPKSVVKLEDLYDLKDWFKISTNSKLQSSTLNYELVNLGTDTKPQNINLGLALAPKEKLAYICLLRQYKSLSAWNYNELKTYDTSIIQHTIPMIDDEKPIEQKLRKVHPNLENQIKFELNKLLKSKIIFLVRHSKWVSNMVPIRKKNGDIRICIDFRNLKKPAKRIIFLLQILQVVTGSELMSFLDGFSGYNQVLVHPDDQLKITFRTKWGTYTYQKMPFGLINAGATFQRAMDIAFKGLVNKSVVIYLDDISVYSKKRINHLRDLKQIFQRCQRYGISLNSKKSFFALSEGKLLRFIVSKFRINIDPHRIEEISKIPLPHNKKAMQYFLGQINFVKRFIQYFSRIVSPLQAMIKNNSNFKWGQDEYEAFNLIKQAIVNAPSLATPNFSDPFILYTFAFDKSYVAILTQANQEKAETPIDFFNSKLHAAKLNYSEMEK
eukprot:PITA_10678